MLFNVRLKMNGNSVEYPGYGSSIHTPKKQFDIEGYTRTELKIIKGILKRHHWPDRYVHIYDITAGPGAHQGDDGSPLIFLRCAKQLNIPLKATFIEQSEAQYSSLRSLIKTSDETRIILGDHNDVLPKLRAPGKNAYGILYVDTTGTIPPFGLLERLSRTAYDRIDFWITVAATSIKRRNGLYNSGNEKFQNIDHRTLSESIKPINKRMWIVREHVGKQHWTILIGSNWIRFPEWKKKGFHDITSPRGRKIMLELDYPVEELADNAEYQELTSRWVA